MAIPTRQDGLRVVGTRFFAALRMTDGTLGMINGARGTTGRALAIMLVAALLVAVAFCASVAPAFSQSSANGEHYYNTSDSPFMNAEQSAKNNPDQKDYMDGPVQHGPHGEVSDKQCSYCTTGANWPAVVPPTSHQTDPRSYAAIKAVNKATAADNPIVGRNLLSGNLAATALSVGMQQAIARAQMPESVMPLAKEMQNQQNQVNADNAANMERNQAGCAIDYVRTYLENFTSNAGNKWNRLRNELFIPMAILLLLPGAVLAQGKAIVAQGFPIFGQVNPFDGIIRAIVAIFLIPATALVVNYGIDLSNSINYSIRDTYKRIFGSDMYRDAMSAHVRAFPVRQPSENKNYIPRRMPTMKEPLGAANTPFAKMEGRSLSIKLEDPVAGLSEVPEDRANEMVPYFVNQQRLAYNGLNAGLATTWTILCAFQMAYLYYLWFVGPVVAALWVYPMKQLRDALPNWVDGVITLCFWSLFWNTTVLIMACFRGVDDTGTVIMTALNFLSTACVKFAFDFSGLVKAAGAEAAKMAEKAAAGGGAKGGGGGKSAAGQGGKSASAPGASPAVNPGKALPDSHASFPGSHSNNNNNNSALASMHNLSNLRGSDTLSEGASRAHLLAAADAGGFPGSFAGERSAKGATTGSSVADALVPPPPGQGATDAVVPGIPSISGQDVGELSPPLLMDRLQQVSAIAAWDTGDADTDSALYTSQALALAGYSDTATYGSDASGGYVATGYSPDLGIDTVNPTTGAPVLSTTGAVAAYEGSYPGGMSNRQRADLGPNNPMTEAQRQLAEQMQAEQSGGNLPGQARGHHERSFAELAALTGAGSIDQRLNSQGSFAAAGSARPGNDLPPALVNGNTINNAYGSRPPVDQSQIVNAINAQYDLVYGDAYLQASLSQLPADDSVVAQTWRQPADTQYQPDPQADAQVTAMNFAPDSQVNYATDNGAGYSVDPGQTTITQTPYGNQYQENNYPTREYSTPVVEYANAAVSSPPDVYAACGLYEPAAPVYQTAAYATPADAAYQVAQAQADVRAARQSAIALALGRACSVAPPA
ncbi:MAG TPA: hypothetical protein V6D08_07275 [Candidatus Obscuribacterales bacterium]